MQTMGDYLSNIGSKVNIPVENILIRTYLIPI